MRKNVKKKLWPTDIWAISDSIRFRGTKKWASLSEAEQEKILAYIEIDDPVEVPPESIPEKMQKIAECEYDIQQYRDFPEDFVDLNTVPLDRVALTREYLGQSVQFINELIPLVDRFKNDKINIFDFEHLRANLYKKLYMRLRYRLRPNIVLEQNKKYREKLKLKKGTTRHVLGTYKDNIRASRFKNPTLIETRAGIIQYPDPKQLIEETLTGVYTMKYVHRDKPDKEYSAMAALQVSAANDIDVIASSRKFRIIDFDESPLDEKTIRNDIENAINELIATVDDYSYVDEVAVQSIFITVTAFAYYDISNWFPQNKLSSNTWSIDGAEIYLANDFSNDKSTIKKSCKQLCVEYLKGTWIDSNDSENIPIYKMLNQKSVLTYSPKTGNIKDVKSFSDLVLVHSTNNEIVDSTDCTNIARIIKANGHMAVITKILSSHKNHKNSSSIQSYRPIPANTVLTYTEIFFDIEAYQDSSADPSATVFYQKPYLLCWTDALSDDVHSIVGENCCAQFVSSLIESYSNTTIVLYAWYGSGYDYHHILTHLISASSSASYVIKNTSIMTTSINFESKNLTIVTKDPFLFILTSLHKAAKAFNVTNKSDFPHNAISSINDLETVLDKWYHTKSEIIQSYPEYANTNNTNMHVYNQTKIIYENHKNTRSTIDHAIEYCKIDVIAMKQIWSKFQSLLAKSFNINVSFNTFTLSQLSMRLLEANLPKKVYLHIPSIEEYNFFKNAIYGGRVIAKNGYYNEEILYADVVSLYPSAMKLLEHSYGKPKKVYKINKSKHGIYNVTLTHIYDNEPPNFTQFVPKRSETGKLTWSWFKSHTATYHTYDLLIAEDIGYKIKCNFGYEFPKKGYIFNKFVSNLFALKNSHSNCNCPEQPCPIRMIAKIALNGGGYGKFVQRPILKSVHIVERDIVASLYEAAPKNHDGKIKLGDTYINPPQFYNLDGDLYDKMVIEQSDIPHYSTACGISILSGSRYRLYNLCKKFNKIDVIYSDTDSIFVRKSTVDELEFANACGSDLGSLDNTIEGSKNNTISKMIILGPKMYAYKYTANNGSQKFSFHAKGVPSNMLTWSQYEHIIKSDNHNILFHFDTISRKITTVATRKLIKKIKQT
jgi:hypothetical protein